MNIAFENRSAACCREVFRQTKLIQEHAECIVSDVLEDVGQILSAEAQICLKSKDVGEHGVSIGATADISVFYITESRECVRCIRLSKELEADFECPALGPDVTAQISLSCQGVQARAVNPRKIAVQITVRADLSCWAPDFLEIPLDPVEPVEGLQLRRDSVESVTTVDLAEKGFVLSEQLPLPADCEPSAIVCARAELLCREYQVIGSKALIKGSAQLRIGFETQTETLPRFIENCLPFSVLLEMPDEASRPGRVILETTALYAELSDAINGSRVVELELHGTAQLSFEKNERVDFISDAYSTRCPVAIEKSAARLCLHSRKESLAASGSERIPVDDERGAVSSCSAELLSFSDKEGKAVLSVSVSLLLRAEDGSYSAQQRLVSLETPLPDADTELLAARIVSAGAERQGGEIVLTLSAEIDCVCSETEEIPYISSLELDTDNAREASTLPSLTVARLAGRELWTLAKLYNSSEEAISALSEKYALPGDLLLIPRV